jgi:hypothetical protein
MLSKKRASGQLQSKTKMTSAWDLIVVAAMPNVNLTSIAEDTVALRLPFPIRDGKQVLSYSLCFVENRGASDRPINDCRVIMISSQNFNREPGLVIHVSSSYRTAEIPGSFPSQSVLLKRAVPRFAGRDADPVLILLHRS